MLEKYWIYKNPFTPIQPGEKSSGFFIFGRILWKNVEYHLLRVYIHGDDNHGKALRRKH